MKATAIALSLSLSLFWMGAFAGPLVDLSIVNRTTGGRLAPYVCDGQSYVAGNPGDRYAVRLQNHTGGRVLVVLSVDGVNAITGRTAAPDQSGYVLDPWQTIQVSGWRKSSRQVAEFYFTRLADSYAARTGRPDNVGVIGAAVFREKVAMPPLEARERLGAPSAKARPGVSGTSAGTLAPMQESSLGTGHGARIDEPTLYTHFDRASSTPDEVDTLRYDSRKNLLARGIIPRIRHPWHEPDAFPGQFVPDPDS